MLLVFASRNPHKIAELGHALDGLPLVIRSAADFPAVPAVEETGTTLVENAFLKARAVHAATGELSLADDTGLEVDALGGAPGVASARFAGPEQDYARNLEKLLQVMRAIPDAQRRARFRTVIAILFPDGTAAQAEGVCAGQILRERRGGGGFGYDPVFWLPEQQRTFAEMTLDEKNLVSHRGRAMQAARKILTAYLARRG